MHGFFLKVLEPPHAKVEESRKLWEYKALFVQSLGRRVPTAWVAKDFKTKLKLVDESEVFALAKDHLLVWFQNEEECSLAKAAGPWFVSGQLLVVEPWQPDFVSSRSPVLRTVVWLWLPELPVEF